MVSELDPLDPELRELWALEQGAYAEDTSARDAVLRRIQSAIVLAPLATGVAVATAAASGTAAAAGAAGAKANLALGLGWKGGGLVAILAFGSGVAVGEAHRTWSEPAIGSGQTAETLVPRTEIVEPPVPASVTPSPVPSLSASVPSAVPSGASSTPHAPAAAPPISDVNEERAVIDTARSALARGLASDALVATEQHAKRFPHGRLAEEREALAIQALAMAGDRNATEARVARFRRSFPSSIFRSAVDRAVSSVQEKKDAAP